MINMYKNKVLLITGGTGSLEIPYCENFRIYKEIRSLETKNKMICVERYDNRLKFYIGDVRGYESIMNAVLV